MPSFRMFSPRRSRRRNAVVAAVASVVAAGSMLAVAPASAAPSTADVACAAMTAPVYQRVNPSTRGSMLTTSETTWQTSDSAYPQDNGVLFYAATAPVDGLVPVHELYNPRNGNRVYIREGGEAANAVSRYRFQDRGIAFYAANRSLDCTDPVYRYRDRSFHRNALESGAGSLIDASWLLEGVSYYAAVTPADAGAPPPTTTSTTTTTTTTPPPPTTTPTTTTAPQPGTDTVFSIAVMPDTQQEVGKDKRFLNRTEWLADHAGADDLDLRFVTHTGDVVNWDTPDHAQYVVASKAMEPLEDAGIPYSLTIGNHDNQATGPGGGARDPKHTRALFRDTSVFNDYFTAEGYGAVQGAYEPGKVDNIWSEFEAGGTRWIVLNLEMYARPSVVEWAKGVVAAAPDANVIVVTHYYLDAGGTISRDAGYGETSAQYLYDNLISQYANIRMVFSGHVGVASSRVDTGVHGNKIYSLLAAIHSNHTNPVRIVEIDTNGSLSTRIVAPWDGATTWRSYDQTFNGISWVR